MPPEDTLYNSNVPFSALAVGGSGLWKHTVTILMVKFCIKGKYKHTQRQSHIVVIRRKLGPSIAHTTGTTMQIQSDCKSISAFSYS
jgi:hypothetical protein